MMGIRQRRIAAVASVMLALVLLPDIVSAHGVFGKDAVFLQGLQGRAIGPLMYLGAKHMVTGYDHLLFLVGVIFFLYRLKDIVQYVSLFTIGHSVTLLARRARRRPRQPLSHRRDHRILGGVQGVREHGRVQAVLRLSAEHADRRARLRLLPRVRPGHQAAGVRALCKTGSSPNIVSFNVGVEIGQVLALAAVLIALTYWRTRSGFLRHAFVTNAVVMGCGFLLVGYQLSGYWVSTL